MLRQNSRVSPPQQNKEKRAHRSVSANRLRRTAQQHVDPSHLDHKRPKFLWQRAHIRADPLSESRKITISGTRQVL